MNKVDLWIKSCSRPPIFTHLVDMLLIWPVGISWSFIISTLKLVDPNTERDPLHRFQCCTSYKQHSTWFNWLDQIPAKLDLTWTFGCLLFVFVSSCFSSSSFLLCAVNRFWFTFHVPAPNSSGSLLHRNIFAAVGVVKISLMLIINNVETFR